MTDDSTEMPSVLRARLADKPLWPFALALYAQEGVEAACLQLQDAAGADVCELLWLGWLDHLGLVPSTDVAKVLAPIRQHQTRVTYPLRARRRALKPIAYPGSPLEKWREHLKRAELVAERETLARLQALAERGEGVRPWRQQDGDLYTRLSRHLGPLDAAAIRSLKTLAEHLAR
ncbi:MAG TPA: TIGR02444 family protein [Halomonas sp.]|nr:TIGR02444 family protein [Halomonas sp.]